MNKHLLKLIRIHLSIEQHLLYKHISSISISNRKFIHSLKYTFINVRFYIYLPKFCVMGSVTSKHKHGEAHIQKHTPKVIRNIPSTFFIA